MPSFRYKLSRDNILALAIYLRSFAVREGARAPAPALPATAAGMTPVQIFRAFCLACHNVDGNGAIVRPGMPDIPDFTVAAWQASKKDEELSKSILSGGKFMPPMKDKLTASDAEQMAKFVRAFKDGMQVVELESPQAEFLAHPLVGASSLGLLSSSHGKGPWLTASALWPERTQFLDSELWKQRKDIVKEKSGVMPPEIAERLRAASVFYRAYCMVCHGPDGTGVPAMRATLPLLPDFTRASFHDQHSDPQLLISILDGKGTQMPSNRGRVTEAQARDLALYVRSFGPIGAIPDPGGGVPSEFQKQFEQLQRQWEALERELRGLQKTSPKL
jgi:mono/diheme cytochrome c family protein